MHGRGIEAAGSPWVRRALLPMLSALALAAAIELGIELRYHPTFWQRSTYVMYDPYRAEQFDRAEVALRLGNLQDSEPDIISVGDSSGFFSLQSTVVNRYLGGLKFISFNTGANHAYDGYYAIAEYMLRHSHHLKYVVLYVYPGLLPVANVFKDADLGPILYDDLVSTNAALTPPSAFLSPYAKFLAFEGRRYHADELGNGSMPVMQLAATVRPALGWLPEFDVRFDRINGRIVFDPDVRPGTRLTRWFEHEHSSIVSTLGRFDHMVRSYNAHLVIAFAPLSRRILVPEDENVAVSDQALARFQREYPDVKFLFPLLTQWGPEKFGMFNHISREYTFLPSARLGEALGRLVRDPAAIAPYEARVTRRRPPYRPITITPTGPPDPALRDAALALFRYTTVTDAADWSLVSHRVQALLEQDPAFGYMMADVKARTASQAQRDIKIGIDLSQMRATPVTVSGVAHCDQRPDLQWVQVDGDMRFTYRSPNGNPTEAVAWPQSAGILYPTIVENGVRKFDGYCPEPSMAAPR